jgi:3-hydroxyisobutyrate dehydrogenase-like beta-hydroxyacid dehydrogenase
MRLGFVGAGRMGRPMVDRLTGAGHEVRVLARSEQARKALDEAGAHPVASAADAARDAEAVDLIRPALGCYGDPILHVGPLGAGQGVKLVNNALFAAQIGLLADAVRLGGEIGVPEAGLLTALQHGSSANLAVRSAAAQGSVAQFTAAVRDFIGKDVAVVRDVAAGLGASLGRIDAAIGALEPSE